MFANNGDKCWQNGARYLLCGIGHINCSHIIMLQVLASHMVDKGKVNLSPAVALNEDPKLKI